MEKNPKKQITIEQMDNKDLQFVHQFLVDHNFANTAGTLIAEAVGKGFQNLHNDSEAASKAYTNSYERMMSSYKSGDWRQFFTLWNLLLPEDAKQTRAYRILTLNLHVYFTMLPKHMLLSHWHKDRDKAQADSVNSPGSLNQQDSEYEEELRVR